MCFGAQHWLVECKMWVGTMNKVTVIKGNMEVKKWSKVTGWSGGVVLLHT